MDSYGHTELLEKEEYEKYKSYFHINKYGTNKLRESLKRLGENYMDFGKIGMLKDNQIIIEIPLNDGKNCLQVKMDEKDFEISHSVDDFVLDLEVSFLMMRIGGISNSRILTAFPKDNIRFILDEKDDFNVG